ncbi:SurA N-terminal domain-containing protein [Jeotgalibacillus marinus]|uniref:peptidylprolyl isomerase n=1 Tax=Jeotgalibacillus marinus TaxID=86667 RepID=A0ABV3Q4R5_9BACL
MKLKKFLLPFAAGALALGLAACSEKDEEAPEGLTEEEQAAALEEMEAKLAEQQVDEDEIVAVVNDEEITGVDYNIALTSIQYEMQQRGQDPTSEEGIEQTKEQALDRLVIQTLVLQKAKEANMTASEEEIDEEYALVGEQYGGEEIIQELLEAQDIEIETFKEQIAESIQYAKYMDEAAPITEEEIQAYYDEVAAEYEEGEAETEEEFPAYEDVSEDIKVTLQNEPFAQHVDELKEEAEIEILI